MRLGRTPQIPDRRLNTKKESLTFSLCLSSEFPPIGRLKAIKFLTRESEVPS